MKGGRRKSGAPAVVYDPEAHREFVLGFRRRKQARRMQAKSTAKEAAKEARRQHRKQKREVMRSSTRVASDSSDGEQQAEDSEQEAGENEQREVVQYEAQDVTVTTVVAPLHSTPVSAPVQTLRKADADAGRSAGESLKARKEVKTGSKSSRKRHVSYTHLLSKKNRRKAKLKAKRERNLKK